MKWVLLDAMGVVYKTGDDTNDLLIPYIIKKNASITKKVINELYMQASFGQIASRVFWQQLGFIHEFPGIEKKYLDDHLELDPEVFQFFQSVDRSVFNVAMLSNDVSEWSLYLREKFRIGSLFNDCIISGDIKCRKPDIEIFNITLHKLNAQPEDCVFVDDRMKNLKTAYELGFHTLLFDRDNIGSEAVEQSGYTEEYVSSFNQLMPAIRRIFDEV